MVENLSVSWSVVMLPRLRMVAGALAMTRSSCRSVGEVSWTDLGRSTGEHGSEEVEGG